MKEVVLGDTGEKVSSFCLGLMHMGSRIDENTSRQIIDYYFDRGGRFLDTANVYTHWVEGGKAGDSEKLLGRWLKDRGRRNDLFIATKVGSPYPKGSKGLGKESIISECEKSLTRLGIDTIDLYYAHRDCRWVPLEESLEAFNSLVKAGKVRHIGVSNYFPHRIEEARMISSANGWAGYSCIQFRYSYLRQNSYGAHSQHLYVDRNMIDYCKFRKMPLIAFSPLLKGVLTDKSKAVPAIYQCKDTDERLKALRQTAGELGLSVSQLALAWMSYRDFPTIPLFSASNMEQMQDNMAAIDVKLSPEIVKYLDEAGNGLDQAYT